MQIKSNLKDFVKESKEMYTRTIVWSIFNLVRSILISNVGTSEYENKSFIPQLKKYLQEMIPMGYRKGIKLIRRFA